MTTKYCRLKFKRLKLQINSWMKASKNRNYDVKMKDRQYQQCLKLLVIGDGGVGKSSLISKYVDDKFSENYLPTIGIDFKEKIVNIGKKKIKLQIWDTAGQERFHNITKAYYRGAHGLVIAFSLDAPNSFHHLQYWLNHINQGCAISCKKILIGTKSDLVYEAKINVGLISALAESVGIQYFEVSSKENKNVENTFIRLANLVVNGNEETEEQNRITLTSQRISRVARRRKCDC